MTDERLRLVEQRVDTHEAVCAQRYQQIVKDLESLNSIVRWVGTGLIGGMGFILVKLVTHL